MKFGFNLKKSTKARTIPACYVFFNLFSFFEEMNF